MQKNSQRFYVSVQDDKRRNTAVKGLHGLVGTLLELMGIHCTHPLLKFDAE